MLRKQFLDAVYMSSKKQKRILTLVVLEPICQDRKCLVCQSGLDVCVERESRPEVGTHVQGNVTIVACHVENTQFHVGLVCRHVGQQAYSRKLPLYHKKSWIQPKTIYNNTVRCYTNTYKYLGFVLMVHMITTVRSL